MFYFCGSVFGIKKYSIDSVFIHNIHLKFPMFHIIIFTFAVGQVKTLSKVESQDLLMVAS